MYVLGNNFEWGTDLAHLISSGRAFQSQGPLTAKAGSPLLFSRDRFDANYDFKKGYDLNNKMIYIRFLIFELDRPPL